VNVRLPRRVDISTNKAVLAAVSDVESRLGKSGRVLLRPSGTEPVVRVMVEGEDPAIVESLARELAEIVSTELASAD
jgi:phosphoglucosamine mutase